MMTIENKSTTLQLTETTKVTYADLLMTCINKPIKEGIDIKSMRRDLRIIGIIEEVLSKSNKGSSLTFTKEDFEYIQKQVEQSVWAIVHKDILDFADYITELV